VITGLYRPGGSVAHLLDPRPKLILLVFFCTAFVLPVPAALLIPHLILIALITALCLGARDLTRPILSIMPILLLILILTPIFFRGGRPLVRLYTWVILSSGGLNETARIFVKFIGITLSFHLFFRTTDLNDLILSLRWFGLPYRLALAVTIAFRYIPDMITTYSNIVDAHKLRMSYPETAASGGGSSESAKHNTPQKASTRSRVRVRLITRLRNLLPVLTSVLIYAIKRIPTLSMALEARGFGRKNTRTNYLELKSRKSLLLEFLITFLIVCLLLVPLLMFA